MVVIREWLLEVKFPMLVDFGEDIFVTSVLFAARRTVEGMPMLEEV